MKYTGLKCPVCGERFKEEDDIVVCPECGAPYHRECYEKSGECIFGELHEHGESWKPDEEDTQAPEASPYEIKDKECPRCGALNGHSATFCIHCGLKLTDEQSETAAPESPFADSYQNRAPGENPYGNNPGVNGQPYNPYGFGGVPFAMDPMGGVSPTDLMDEGVSYGEASKIVAVNTQYYMPVFKTKQALGRGKFNFCAFIFSGGWFLYRKMYKPGIILSAIMFTMLLANNLLSYILTLPILDGYVTQLGYDITTATMAEYSEAINLLISTGTGMELFLALIPSLISIVMFVVMIVCGFKANNAYMKYCTETVKDLKSTSLSTEDASAEQIKRSGVNPTAALILMLFYFVCQYLPTFLL